MMKLLILTMVRNFEVMLTNAEQPNVELCIVTW
jgi:hypothetical protein